MSSQRPVVPPRVALAAFAAASLVAAWTLHRALALEPAASFQAASADALPVPAAGTGTPAARLAAAVGRDPFHPERRKPAVRFRLPGESLQGDTMPPPAAGGPLVLIGTAVLSGGGGFAMCQWGGEAPKLVRLGERIGNLTLRGVARGRATFVDAAGRRVEVRVPKAGT